MRQTTCFLVLIILLGFSCSRGKRAEEFTIHGQFSNSHGEKVVFGEMDVREFITLDSAETGADGIISFSCRSDQPGFYFLQFKNGERMILLMEPKEHLTIKGDIREKPETFILEGSEGSELLQTFFRASIRNKERVDSVKAILLQHEGSEDFLRIGMKADSAFSRITGDQKKLERDFIDLHPQSLASLVVLNYTIGLKPVLTPEPDLDYYRKLTDLYKQYPANKHVLFHLKRMKLIEEKSTVQKN
ncbi:MAG: DUF4369 domain-containing protein [Bacteroidetes bacterium]|nr:DUF4369 domain-containing protein [Bacteroidota bacterium]